MRAAYLLAIATVPLVAAGPGGSDRDPAGYAVRLPITPAPSGGVQRIALPPAAIVALRNRDGTDVRVFDGRGRPVPIARIAPAPSLRRDALTPLPILGGRGVRMGARVSIRLDDRGQARVAEVENGVAGARDTATLGALLDARGVAGAAERLDIAADIPVGQPVRVTVEASPDLDRWRPLGERILYRAPGTAIVSAPVALGFAPLDRDYLRVTWRTSEPLIAPVTLRTASLASAGGESRIIVAARAPALIDDHALEFVVPAATPVSLRVLPAPGDGAVAIRLLGRDDRERPWTPLASGIAAADAPAMALGAAPRVIRIEADRRGAGFSAPPALELGFAPRALAFAASGQGPHRLAAGRSGAEDPFSPLAELAPAGALRDAQVDGDTLAEPLALSAPEHEGTARQAVLWSVLLAAVALLAGLVWWIVRRTPAPGEG